MRRCVGMALALMAVTGPASAADFDGPYADPGLPPLPRYFPRGDGMEPVPPPPVVGGRLRVACKPRRVPTPTDAPDDPSYVGSPYGLGHPSYYGFTPPLGVDDPYGRSVLPYCR